MPVRGDLDSVYATNAKHKCRRMIGRPFINHTRVAALHDASPFPIAVAHNLIRRGALFFLLAVTRGSQSCQRCRRDTSSLEKCLVHAWFPPEELCRRTYARAAQRARPAACFFSYSILLRELGGSEL